MNLLKRYIEKREIKKKLKELYKLWSSAMYLFADGTWRVENKRHLFHIQNLQQLIDEQRNKMKGDHETQ